MAVAGVGQPAIESYRKAFALVDPKDEPWVFFSHDDLDHTGYLGPVRKRCPNAVLVTTWSGVGRMADHFELSMDAPQAHLSPELSLHVLDELMAAAGIEPS